MFPCISAPYFLYSFSHWGASRLFASYSYSEQCCYEFSSLWHDWVSFRYKPKRRNAGSWDWLPVYLLMRECKWVDLDLGRADKELRRVHEENHNLNILFKSNIYFNKDTKLLKSQPLFLVLFSFQCTNWATYKAHVIIIFSTKLLWGHQQAYYM